MFTPFQNEPYVNFSEERPNRKMIEALSRVAGELGRTYPVIINGVRIETPHINTSRNPAKLSQIVGHVCDATPEMADRAVEAATKAFAEWSLVPVEVRARFLVKLAAVLRRRIYEFSAWMVYESSKSWNEAYADAAEAIDFLEFYAREALRWGAPHPTTIYPGEENEVRYLSLGVGAVISPWNFPLAIMAGMTVAAVVTGNTVILKPAEQTPVIAAKFMEAVESVGLPPGVVNFLPGPGGTVGEALTGHPGIRFVSFTGSKDVGLRIYQRIATPQPGQRWLKRAVLEMGGKDAIIVDDGVNVDVAAEGVVASAFGFQGQKCSACSRLIAHANVYDALLAKVVERASRLTVGDPAQYSNYMGAVIDEEAYRRILSYIAIGRTEGRIVLGEDNTEDAPEAGYYVKPTIFADVPSSARIAQEEIFGPVLAVIKANDFDHALAIANDTPYALTGALYSNDRFHLERARHEFHVGNLYLNRKCTGALVDVQPFGGFNLSGTDSKAGGRDYLGLFLQAKSVCERW
ncbi:MAG TPA: L-glutamate gamma-semialdehyde dehydrogenase [Chthonomonadaceae bacterium]|nr:L-glutamate gamma-semialdehyde dehydrogenase [Chthonomonadaceae bacterium]